MRVAWFAGAISCRGPTVSVSPIASVSDDDGPGRDLDDRRRKEDLAFHRMLGLLLIEFALLLDGFDRLLALATRRRPMQDDEIDVIADQQQQAAAAPARRAARTCG